MFTATLAYELAPSTAPEAKKLLLAELVGRRYNDRFEGKKLPAGCVWIRRSKADDETVDDLARRIHVELEDAVAAVARAGLVIKLMRGWVQVSGAGTWALLEPGASGEEKA